MDRTAQDAAAWSLQDVAGVHVWRPVSGRSRAISSARATDTVALRPSGPRSLCFSISSADIGAGTGTLHWDVLQLQAARSKPILHMNRLAAENPVWLVSACWQQTGDE